MAAAAASGQAGFDRTVTNTGGQQGQGQQPTATKTLLGA
jgi:hypothetical protein